MSFEKNCLIPSIIAGVLGLGFVGCLIGVIVLAVQAGQTKDESSSLPEPIEPIVFKEYTAKIRQVSCYGPHCYTDDQPTFMYSFGVGKFAIENEDEKGKVTYRSFSTKSDQSLTSCSSLGNHDNCYTVTAPDDGIILSTEGLQLVERKVSCSSLIPQGWNPSRKLDKCDYYVGAMIGAPTSSQDSIQQVVVESDTGYPVFNTDTVFEAESKSYTVFDSFSPKKPSDEKHLQPFPGVTVYDFRNGEGDCSEEPTFSKRDTPNPEIEQLFNRKKHQNSLQFVLNSEMRSFSRHDSSHIREPAVRRDPREIPKEFDARTQWPDCAEIIGTITMQNPCGSCWAMSSAGVLSDRMCIAKNVKQLLSPQYMMFCGHHTGGCNGGAATIPPWEQLIDQGTVPDDCIPYYGREGDCPGVCKNDTLITEDMITRAKSYTVPWGNTSETRVQAIQNEIMTNGPVQTGFIVFSDFGQYESGVYHRTKNAVVKGGHAVRIIGWGTTNDGVDYWLVANSWSTRWAKEDGFFRIRRGNNECNFEEDVIAGLVN